MVARVIDHPAYTGVIPTPYNPDPVLLAIVQTIRDGLLRDQHVRLQNFGTFRLRWSKERKIKHPKTGEYITVAPAPKITFTPAKHLRERIEPNPKPVIPLDGSAAATIYTNAKQQSNTENNAEEASLEYNVQETIQNIVDEEYSPSSTPSNITIADSKKTASNTNNYINKKWALGFLAAVPAILLMLQIDLSSENTVRNPTIVSTSITTPEITESIINETVTIKPILKNTFPDGKIIRNTAAENSTPPATARAKPTQKPFYLNPQLHTIEKGDNLWRLAEKFYGDALLWPHIYRANTRTLNDPDIIIPGKQIVIPGLQQSPKSLSSNDKDLVSEGYFKVYQLNKGKHSPQAIYFLIAAKEYSFDWVRNNRKNIANKDWETINRH